MVRLNLKRIKRALTSVAVSSGLTLSAAVHAQSPVEGRPELIFEAGKPITLTYQDGRVAALKVYRSVIPNLTVSFEVFENLCASSQGQSCQYHFSAKEVWMPLVWTHHPNPEKIGKPVHAKGNPEQKFAVEDFIVSDAKQFFPILGQGLSSTRFSCDNWSWLPGGSAQTPPRQTLIKRWGSETMIPNPETGINENTTLGGATNVEFRVTPNNELELVKMRSIEKVQNFSSDLLIFGDNVSFTMKMLSDSCQISIKPGSFDNAGLILQEASARRPQPEEIDQFYIFGDDELSFGSQESSLFRELSFISSNPGDQVE